ncbi:hypothetical protein IMCC21906_02105 [Spongiibacter sp. IMCC21906]|uniref:hypothetical protein n=1 Tax=Spongiibacter sp. IMCC21906 TaxID=1620392 RepID=UPI00062DD988|nr:hypothetical protein [Spongiibacter sp. IMCC21906]AKH69773.1 hypothetical protein IMCC21906_02105 [Spongiibacter sp. IMCC21906]
MTLRIEINPSSIALVYEELSNTLQKATNVFETFLAERHSLELLNQCETDLRQIGGTLRLLEVPGAALIADEMRFLCRSILDKTEAVPEAQLNALSTAFFVLPRYLEYVQSNKADIPIMALPHANELRSAHGQFLLPDNYFNTQESSLFSRDSKLRVKSQALAPELLIKHFARQRQIYQTGLLGVLRDNKLQPHVELMSRALRRLCAVIEPGPEQRFWLLANALMDAFAQGGLELSAQRKRVLGALEGQMRGKLKGRRVGNELLERELCYLLQLSSVKEGLCHRVMAAAGLQPEALSDAELQQMRQQMLGLSYDTVSSVLNELRGELRHARDILELLAQHGRSDTDEIEPLMQLLKQSSDVLKLLNLPSLATMLVEHNGSLARLIGQPLDNKQADLALLAESLLFIESSLAQIDRRQLNYSDLADLDSVKIDRINTDNQLAIARDIVIQESKDIISLVKRSISAYADSGYDATHIGTLPDLLHSVRGAFKLMNMPKITEVMRAAAVFMDRFVHRSNIEISEDNKTLETLADTMISIEYYLNELGRHYVADDQILRLAEDSLAELREKVMKV